MPYSRGRGSAAYTYDYEDMLAHFSRGSVAEQVETAETPAVEEAPQLRVIPGGKARPRTFFRPRSLVTLFGVLMGAGLVLHSYMQVSVLTSKVAEARDELSQQQAIHTALLTKQEYVLSDETIEAYAAESGMYKLDNSQVEWYEMSNPDKVEVSGAGAKLGGVLDRLMHSFSAALSYLG